MAERSRTIVLGAKTPRDVKAAIEQGLDLEKGVKAELYFGYFFYVGAVFIAVTGVIGLIAGARIPVAAVLISPFAAAAFGYLLLHRPAAARLRTRRLAFERGAIMDAKVAGHTKEMVAYKSTRAHVILVGVELPDGRTIYGRFRGDEWDDRHLTKGVTVPVLCDPESGSVLVGRELGVTFVMEESEADTDEGDEEELAAE